MKIGKAAHEVPAGTDVIRALRRAGLSWARARRARETVLRQWIVFHGGRVTVSLPRFEVIEHGFRRTP